MVLYYLLYIHLLTYKLLLYVRYNNLSSKKILIRINQTSNSFDISKYFSEINYQRECNSRFEDLHKFFTVNKSRKKLLLFATHLDKCKGKKDKILFNFKDLIKEKEYKSLIDKLYLINMLNYEELKQSVDKIFEKK